MAYGVIDDTARVRGFYCICIFCVEFHPYAPEKGVRGRTTWVSVPMPGTVRAKLNRLRQIHRRLSNPDAS